MKGSLLNQKWFFNGITACKNTLLEQIYILFYVTVFSFFCPQGSWENSATARGLKKSLQKCWGIARRLCLIATPPGVQVWLCKYNSRVWCWRRVHFHWLVGLCVLYDWDSSGFSSVRTGYTGLKESRASESLSSIERDIFRSASCLHCSCQRLMEQKWSAGV